MSNKNFKHQSFLHVHVAVSFLKLKTSSGMEAYESACCISGFHVWEVSSTLAKFFVHDSLTTTLFARAVICVDRHVNNNISGF